MTTNPALACQPVIINHLSMSGASEGLTACSGQPFQADGGYQHRNVPRVLCEACRRAALNEQWETSNPNAPLGTDARPL